MKVIFSKMDERQKGQVAVGSTITETFDESFDYGSLIYLNCVPEPFRVGQGVEITMEDAEGRKTFSMTVAADSVTIGARTEGAPTRYRHDISLIERTAILTKYPFGGMSFPRTGSKPWTMGEALNRVLAVEPLRAVASDPAALAPFTPALTPEQSSFEIPELTLNTGTLFDALNALANTADSVVYLDTESHVHLRRLAPTGKEAQATRIYNFKTDMSFEDYAEGVVSFTSEAIPGGSVYSGGRNYPNTPRSETVYCRTDNLFLKTDFPIYRILKVYAFIDTNYRQLPFPAFYNSAGGQDHIVAYLPSYPALGTVKVDLSDFFVTAEQFETMTFDEKNSHFFYRQGSDKIELTAAVQDDPFFQESKIVKVIEEAYKQQNVAFLQRVHDLITGTGATIQTSDDFRTFPGLTAPSYNGETPQGFAFQFQIDYIPYVQARLVTPKPGIPDPQAFLFSTAAQTPATLERLGENALGLARRIGNDKVTINRRILSVAELNNFGAHISKEHPEYILTAQTVIYNLDSYDVTEIYQKNYNRRATYTGTDIVYRETVRAAAEVPRFINYFDPNGRLKPEILTNKFYARVQLRDSNNAGLGPILTRSVAVSRFGDTVAFIFTLGGANIVGSKVIETGQHRELQPVPAATDPLPRENRLWVALYYDKTPCRQASTNLNFMKKGSGSENYETSYRFEESSLVMVPDELLNNRVVGPNGYLEKAFMVFPAGYYSIRPALYDDSGTGKPNIGIMIDKSYQWLGDSVDMLTDVLDCYGQTQDIYETGRAIADNYPEGQETAGNNSYPVAAYILRVDKSDTEALTVTIQIPFEEPGGDVT